MRILYFSRDYTTHDRRFLAKIAESGHDVFFLRLHDDGVDYEKRDLPPGASAVPWHGISERIGLEACLNHMPDFERVLDEVRPDVLHAGPITSCAFMAALSGFHPLMSMSWGSDILVDTVEHEQLRWAARFALNRSDLVAVDCDAVRERIRALTGAADDRFVQFPWGLELAEFPRLKPRTGPRNEIVVVSTRSWAPIYGLDTVIEAFALAYREDPRLRLVLLGDGPLAGVIDAEIVRRNLSTVVRRPGRVPEEEVYHYFAAADIYLSCARSDGTSISLLAAMAAGLPVVATDVGGNREWVTPQRGGFLAAAEPAAFAHALLQAARLDDCRRTEIAAYNRDVIERRADWHANTRQLIAAYARLVAHRSGAA